MPINRDELIPKAATVSEQGLLLKGLTRIRGAQRHTDMHLTLKASVLGIPNTPFSALCICLGTRNFPICIHRSHLYLRQAVRMHSCQVEYMKTIQKLTVTGALISLPSQDFFSFLFFLSCSTESIENSLRGESFKILLKVMSSKALLRPMETPKIQRWFLTQNKIMFRSS